MHVKLRFSKLGGDITKNAIRQPDVGYCNIKNYNLPSFSGYLPKVVFFVKKNKINTTRNLTQKNLILFKLP